MDLAGQLSIGRLRHDYGAVGIRIHLMVRSLDPTVFLYGTGSVLVSQLELNRTLEIGSLLWMDFGTGFLSWMDLTILDLGFSIL